MKKLIALSSAVCALTIPAVVAAQELWIYCGNLPGCGPGWQEYFSGALYILIERLPIYVSALGVLFIMVGGAYMILSAGNSERAEKGKKAIMWSVIGLFIMSFSVELVGFVVLETTSRISAPDLVESAVYTLQSSVFSLLYVALLGVAIFCGMWMVVARGKEEDFAKAHTGLFWAAIGAIIVNLADALARAFVFF